MIGKVLRKTYPAKIRKIVEKSCLEVVIENDGSCSEAKEILTSHGFHLTFLNVIFGLLPITIHRSDVTYGLFSLSSFYVWMFVLAVCYISFRLSTIVSNLYYEELTTTPSTADALINLAQKGHIIGFIFLTLRGRFIARKYPQLWHKLSVTFQNSVISLRGKEYKPVRLLGAFSRRCVLFYLLVLIANESELWNDVGALTRTYEKSYGSHGVSILEQILFLGGFILWDLTVMSHVLVSMLLLYYIFALDICLKSVNNRFKVVLQSIKDAQTTTQLNSVNSGAIFQVPKQSSVPMIQISGPRDQRESLQTNLSDEELLKSLNHIKNCYHQVEEVLEDLSSLMGVSIVIEVFILVANAISNIYLLLLRNSFILDGSGEHLTDYVTSTIEPLMELICHTSFFYWLTIVVTSLKTEVMSGVFYGNLLSRCNQATI
ncbi:unnamed protein product [Allacma fusca]|uniref:Uncharacterized protein n=1 Tax=Allacma fusca TaxID=39272 RepID=A0A8J2NZM9_9HEXA|nr:unnamed protein product [Allacma fusca]